MRRAAHSRSGPGDVPSSRQLPAEEKWARAHFRTLGGATGEADCFLKHGCNHRFGEHTSCLWENARFLKIGGDTGCPVERGCETSFLDETP